MTNMIVNNKTVASYFSDVKYSEEDMENLSSKDTISVTDSFFLKSKSWEYENEMRYLYFDVEGSGDHKQIDVKDCIAAIYFGLRCSDDDKRTIMEILKGKKWKQSIPANIVDGTKEHDEDRNIEFYQIEKDSKKFGRLIVRRIK